MEGILFGITDKLNASNNSQTINEDESPPPLPLRQPRGVKHPVSRIPILNPFYIFCDLSILRNEKMFM